METGERAVFYARVSTQEEAQLKALPKQVDECKDKIKEKGWDLVDQYVDEGKSGTTIKHRTEYQRLLDDMELNKFDVIVVKSQDRLQRNPKDWYIFLDKLVCNDIKLFIYLDNQFYTTDNALITGIKAILASEYSRDLSKKLNNANKRRIERARAGERVPAMGNSQMYGYRIINGKWIIDTEEAKIVKKMYELYLELHSISKVRNALNDLGYRNKAGRLFTDEVVGRVLKNEKHKGWAILNRYHRNFDTKEIEELPEDEWVIVKNDHKPIVSEEMWDKVNNEIQSHRNKGNNKGRGKRMGNDIMSGKLFCNCCGKVMWKHTSVNKSGKYSQWYCSGKMGSGKLACTDPATISVAQLKKYLLEIANTLLDYSNIEYSKNILKKRSLNWLKELREQLAAPNNNDKIGEEIKKLEGRKSKLIDLYTDGLITKEDFAVKCSELDNNLATQRALLVPVEENADIKVIDDTIANIDEEIEKLFEDEAMVEEKKLLFIAEHIKRVLVLSNKDVFIVLDSIAGAFLFVAGGEARIDIVPVEDFKPEGLSEVCIAENEIVPFDRENMPFPHGRIFIKRHGK